MKTLSVQVPDEINLKIMNKIKKENTTKSAYIRNLILKDLEKPKKIIKPKQTKPKVSMLSKLQSAFGVTGTTVKKTKRNQRKPYNSFVPVGHDKKIYKNPFIRNNQIKGKGEKNRIYSTGWTVDELLVVYEQYENFGEFFYKDINDFAELLNKHTHSVRRMCYNIIEGTFDKMLSEFKTKLGEVRFNLASNENGEVIVMNDVITDITVTLAKEFTALMCNTAYSDKAIYEIQKTYERIDPLAVRVICENYQNDDLTDILKSHYNYSVINNPSKRRNFIRNGGILE